MTPLAERIYDALVGQLRFPNPLISYGDLVRGLGSLPAPYTDLKPNDQRLFEALGEIVRACQNHEPPLPALSSLVVRRTEDGGLGTPGAGYFVMAFPHVRDERARHQMWQAEVRRVVASSYPESLDSVSVFRPVERSVFPRWLREPTVIAAIIGLAGTLLTVIISGWIAIRPGQPAQPPQAGQVVVQIVPQEKLLQPRQPDPPGPKIAPPTPALTLDDILDVLERHHQRATFGAVAGVLGRDPQSLFEGYVRSPRTAWVVSKATGLPTGTKKSDYPPGLEQNQQVINTSEDLRVWLLNPR